MAAFNLTRKRTRCCHVLFVHPIAKEKKIKKKKDGYVLLTVNWLQGFHTQLQGKALHSIWTGFSFWWLGCSCVGGWSASEQSLSTEQGEAACQGVVSHGGELRHFQRRQLQQSLNCEANLHQTPFLQNVMRQAKSLLQKNTGHWTSSMPWSSRWGTNTFSEATHPRKKVAEKTPLALNITRCSLPQQNGQKLF